MITIDPFYNLEMFDRVLQSLKNNNIKPELFIDIRSPHNWWIDVEKTPFLDCIEAKRDDYRFMVSKVKPVRIEQEYRCRRKFDEISFKGVTKHAINDAFRNGQKSENAYFINVNNFQHAVDLSKKYGKIWWLGYYDNRRFRVCLCTNPYIEMEKNINILTTKKENSGSILKCELFLNEHIFQFRDRIKKYYETPYFLNGKYIPQSAPKSEVLR